MATGTLISPALREQFVEEGYFILEDIMSAEHLQILRDSLDVHIANVDAEMDAKGIETDGISHKGKRYFIAMRNKQTPRMREFLFSDLMADICRATLGDDAWMFWEQFVVKAPEVGMKFSWHQDSGYLRTSVPDHNRPYLTCWCALDDVTEENGTVYLLPFSKAGTREILTHSKDDEYNDLVGYFGDEQGVPVIAPAGSIAVFSTNVFHRSGANTTDNWRRSYVCQYSAEIIRRPDGSLAGFAGPFLRDGERVDS